MSAYSIEISQTDDQRTITFGGALVINHIDKIVSELKEKLGDTLSAANTKVVINNPENADMTFLQLVLAIKRSATQAGKNFELQSAFKDDLKELLVKAGLDKQFAL